jgi:ribonuclease Z
LPHAALFRESVSLAEQLSHSVPTFGYALTEPDGRRLLPDKLAVAGIAGPDVGRLQRDGRLLTDDGLVTVAQVSELRAGQRFAFIMDTGLCEAAFALAERADMLVCESTFADADAPLAQEFQHLTAGQAGRIAAEAGAGLLVLTTSRSAMTTKPLSAWRGRRRPGA